MILSLIKFKAFPKTNKNRYQQLLVGYQPRSNDVIYDNKFPIGHGLGSTALTQPMDNRNELSIS